MHCIPYVMRITFNGTWADHIVKLIEGIYLALSSGLVWVEWVSNVGPRKFYEIDQISKPMSCQSCHAAKWIIFLEYRWASVAQTLVLVILLNLFYSLLNWHKCLHRFNLKHYMAIKSSCFYTIIKEQNLILIPNLII